MQLTRQLADFMVQTTIARFVKFIDQFYCFAKITFFEAIHQLASIGFQSRLEVTLLGIIVFHSALAADISR
jgi:hypothetical protein